MKDPFNIHESNSPLRTPENLSWEEAAQYPSSSVEGFVRTQGSLRTIWWIPVLLVVCFVVLVSQLVRLQVVGGKEFRAMAEGNRLRERIILAPRGYIKDRSGEILAQNTAGFRLIAIPVDLPKDGLEGEVSALATVLGLPLPALTTALSKVDTKSFEPVVLAEDISRDQSILFETRSSEFLGFQVEATPIREYTNAEMFSHVLGFTGIVSSNDLHDTELAGYSAQDYIGKTGIEQQYERFVRGQNGQEQIEVDATGRVVKTLGTVNPKPGNILELNIDKELQEKLYTELLQKGVKGAAVALDPKTGQVLALVSVPGFNNNLFAHGIKTEQYKGLLEDKNLPLFNRAIAGTYPPGSTVKIMGALAALEEGVVSESTVIMDRGVLVIPNQYDSRIQYNFYGWKRAGLGPMTVRTAIAESSDIYFYTVSGGHPASSITGLGAEKLASFYRRFGLGKPTGIDLPGEKSGVVADPAWKAEYFKDNSILKQWYLGDTYHIGIGQGDMLTTPLQVAVWTSSIANNGVAYKPTLLKRVVDQQGKIVFEPPREKVVDLGTSEKNLKVVQEGMRLTVTNGSGNQLSTLPIEAAGKTGTSQFDGSDMSRTHAWFTSYAPFNNPQIVVTVLVEAGGEGHEAAVPVAKSTLQWWAENRYGKK